MIICYYYYYYAGIHVHVYSIKKITNLMACTNENYLYKIPQSTCRMYGKIRHTWL